MRNLKHRYFALLTALFCTGLLFGQTPQSVPVIVSERIEQVHGTYYHLHTVEKGQTMYSISRAYQVTSGEIKRTSDKLEIQVGETLMIPVNAKRLKTLKKNESSEIAASKHSPFKHDSAKSVKPIALIDSGQTDTTQGYVLKPLKSTLNVALMLPLFLNDVSQIHIDPTDKEKKPAIKSFVFVSFYEGVALAAQNFDKANTKINLHVFDVTDDENTAANLIRSGKLNDMDLIIGPVFLRAFKMMSDYAQKQQIYIINPLSDRNEILNENPYVIRINPSKEDQLQALLDYISQNDKNKRIILLSDTASEQENAFLRQAESHFKMSKNRIDTVFSLPIPHAKFQNLHSSLSHTTGSTIVYLSENEPFITEVLTQASKRKQTSDVLYCLHKLPQFEFIESGYMNDLHMHYATPFFVDYSNENARNFECLFYETYQNLPDSYAYMGYDIMQYVLHLLEVGNTNYENYLETTVYKGFHNTIRIKRANPMHGFENPSINILKIEDSKLKKVNE